MSINNCYHCNKCKMDRQYIFTCTITGKEDYKGDGWCDKFEPKEGA